MKVFIEQGLIEDIYAAVAAGENFRALELIHESDLGMRLNPPHNELRLQARLRQARVKEAAA